MTDDMRKLIEEEKAIAIAENKTVAVHPENAIALDTSEANEKIKQQVTEALTDQANIDKNAKRLKGIGQKLIDNSIGEQENIALFGRAKNKADRQAINNRTYVLKQEKKRLIKEQKFLNKQQIDTQKAELKTKRWNMFSKTLSKYGFSEMPNLFIAFIILALDAIKASFEAISQINDKLAKMLKYVVILIGISLVLITIPSTRDWLFNLLT